MKSTLALLIISIVFSLPLSADSSVDSDIKTAFVITGQWNNYTNRDGSGYYFDILKEIYDPLGIEIDMQFSPYLRSYSVLKSGKADILLGALPNMLDKTWYSTLPVEKNTVSIAISISSSTDWQGLESLKTLSSVARLGTFVYQPIERGTEHFEVESTDEMMKMLITKRVDIAIDFDVMLMDGLKRFNIEDQFIIKNTPLTTHFYFAFNNSEKGLMLKEIFNRELEKITNSGRLREIMLKNIGDDQFLP